MSLPSHQRRLLFVHAHPDDESINNGVTMARYAAEGAAVTLVTCTLGEEGEVIPSELAHLASDRDDTLGPYREGELAAAMREVGVSDHRFLGGAGRYRDSGMMGVPQNEHPASFWQAPLDEAAGLLARIIRETRPQVLVTYDSDGGYGHPDHIKAHRVAVRAVQLAADAAFAPESEPAHQVARVYWNCVPNSALNAAAFAGNPFSETAGPSDVPGVVEDGRVAVRIEGSADHRAAKAAAMRAHATQILVEGDFFALSNWLGQPIQTTECYQLPEDGPNLHTPTTDLFAGVEL